MSQSRGVATIVSRLPGKPSHQSEATSVLINDVINSNTLSNCHLHACTCRTHMVPQSIYMTIKN